MNLIYHDTSTSAQHNEVLDALDIKILQTLQEDASLTNRELAERVGTSAPTCLRRVSRLEASGIIERVVAILRPERVGRAMTALVHVELINRSSESLAAFEEKMAQEPAVRQCYRISGGLDFFVLICVDDIEAYREIEERLFTEKQGIANVKVYFSVHRRVIPPQKRCVQK